MYEDRFTKWMKWEDRNNAVDVGYPGIYVCSISNQDIAGNEFTWLPEIIYIGMTNSLNGLKGRLKQFDNTIIGKRGHGGADRIRYKHENYQELVDQLFVVVSPFKCSVKSGHPSDLRVMGEVEKFEYDCLAFFVETYGSLPEFNNKKKSPKYSLTKGRKNAS